MTGLPTPVASTAIEGFSGSLFTRWSSRLTIERVRRVSKTLEVPDVVGVLLPLLEDRDGRVVRRLAEVDADDEPHCSDSVMRLDVVEEDVARGKGQRLRAAAHPGRAA